MSKPNLVVIVEGPTESAALRELLTEHLRSCGLSTVFQVIGERGKQAGGEKPFSTLLNNIRSTAKMYRGVYISTCFDYYALSSRWPKVAAIKHEKIDVSLKAANIEAALFEAVTAKIGPDILWCDHFIPHIQLYEIETLLFVAPELLGQELVPKNSSFDLKAHFAEIVSKHNNQCEMINDSVDTAPSKRLEKKTNYKKGKTGHARIILPQIGLARIRGACPHFNEWIERLENIHA